MRAVERRIKRTAARLLGGLSSGRKIDLRNIDLSSVRRVLLVKQDDQLGDFLLFSPVLPAVRKRFPHARLILCTRAYTKDVVLEDPVLDDLVVIEERLDHWRPGKLAKVFSSLARRPDLAVVFNTVSHSFTNDIIALSSRARYRLGPREPLMPGTRRNAFYNIEVPVPPGRTHITDRYLSIVEPLGVPVDGVSERMHLADRWKREAEELLASWGVNADALLFALHPGGARSHARWPPEKYAALGDRLSQLDGGRVIVVSGRGETFGIDVIERMRADAIDCRVTNLRLLAGIFARAAVYVGNDTGLLHVAASLGTRTVGIYGETDPGVWKPKGEHVEAVRSAKREIGAVSVDDVYAAVLRMLS